MKVSIGIPSFNSSDYVNELLKNLQNNKSISEIVINDDCSDEENSSKMNKILLNFKKSSNIPISLFSNNENKGAYINKYKTVEQCTGEIVYLIDSDNLPMNQLDILLEEDIVMKFDKNTIYYPSKIYQFKRYPYLSKIISPFMSRYKVKFFNHDKTIDYQEVVINIKKYTKGSNTFTIDKDITWFLNCGNFIIGREAFLETFDEGMNLSREKLAVDALAFSYYWLNSGKKIKSLKNFYHYHRKRTDSVSFIEKDNNDKSVDYFFNKFLKEV